MTGVRSREEHVSRTEGTVASQSPQQRSVAGLKRKSTSDDQPDEHRQHGSGVLPASGFLGSTSYSAVFTENQEQLGLDNDENGEASMRLQKPLLTPTNLNTRNEEGCMVLRELRDFPHIEKIGYTWGENACDFTLMSSRLVDCINSIRDDIYVPYVQEKQDLVRAVELLFDAFSRPVKIAPGCKFKEFAEQFTGKNIRWETLGMFFTAVGLRVMQMPVTDPMLAFVDNTQEGKYGLARRMLEASDYCICFCDTHGHLNDPGIWLITENTILMSQVLGDASKWSVALQESLWSTTLLRGCNYAGACLTKSRLPHLAPSWRSVDWRFCFGVASRDQDVSRSAVLAC